MTTYNFNATIKYLLVFIFLVFSLFKAQAQVTVLKPSTNKTERFIEWNIGVAAVLDDTDSFIFPGTSVLYGESRVYNNKWVFEYELGLAFPSLATGKIGVGLKKNTFKSLIGIRPYPFTTFYQMSFETGKKGDLILSFEYNPLDASNNLSVLSKGNFNLGYRWILKSQREEPGVVDF